MKDKIKTFLQERIGKEVPLADDDNIFELGLVNSLFALQLVMFLENNFSIEMDNDDLDIKNFSTLNNLESLVLRKLQPQ
ncbi:MAG: phosphopantetheine-binding protein [Bacteroidota bacterium]